MPIVKKGSGSLAVIFVQFSETKYTIQPNMLTTDMLSTLTLNSFNKITMKFQ